MTNCYLPKNDPILRNFDRAAFDKAVLSECEHRQSCTVAIKNSLFGLTAA